MRQIITRCSKCGRKINVRTVDVHRKGSAVQQNLVLASCDRCRHTIYGDSIKEVTR